MCIRDRSMASSIISLTSVRVVAWSILSILLILLCLSLIHISEYVNKHDDFILYDVYIDDGFTGTNFDRPDFHRDVYKRQILRYEE